MRSPGFHYKKIGQNMHAARQRGDMISIAGVWLGIAAVAALVGGVIAHVPNLAGAGIAAGLVAIVLARITRRHARATGDEGRAYLGRVGQLVGWLAAGPFVLLGLGVVGLTILMVLLLAIIH